MKDNRQNIIIDIITNQEIETQYQLQQALLERGIHSTQSTLSRDIKDMRLTKELGSNGIYHYVQSARPVKDDSLDKLKQILKASIISFNVAQNIVVIKTLPGLASAACSAFDGMEINNLVGTLAGDDTAFLAMKDSSSAIRLYHEIETLF